jgi:hypothetical protein
MANDCKGKGTKIPIEEKVGHTQEAEMENT